MVQPVRPRDAAGLRVGFAIQGMTGPGSGVWTRFDSLVRGLTGAGVDVHVLATADQAGHLQDLPVHQHVIPDESRLRRLVSRKAHLEDFIALAGLDVVHIESPPFPVVAGAPTIASLHDLRGLYGAPWKGLTLEKAYQRTLLRRQIRNMSAVSTLSPSVADEIVGRLGVDAATVHVIPPIVTGPSETATIDDPDTPGAPFVLVLGHLETRKNVATIIKAASLYSWPREVSLVVAGRDAGEGRALQALATACRCHVEFLGSVDESTKWSLLASASLVLVPSLVEGFGIVAVEAPLVGTPVLVSDRPALPEVSGDPSAILPALDADAWAQRIAALLGDGGELDALVAKQHLSALRFSADAVIPAVLGLYRSLLDGPTEQQSLPVKPT